MTLQTVSLSSLEPGRGNPRKAMDRNGLEGLAASIRNDGLLQNLVVKPVKGKGEHYRIVSGERRYRALKLLEQRGELDGDFAVPVEIRDQPVQGRQFAHRHRRKPAAAEFDAAGGSGGVDQADPQRRDARRCGGADRLKPDHHQAASGAQRTVRGDKGGAGAGHHQPVAGGGDDLGQR